MAKKKKNRSRKQNQKAVKLECLSAEELLAKGNSLISHEKFQEALICFKQLLKIKDSPEVLAGLEKAYRGRINALAAKSLTKEALALIDVMAKRCPDADVDSLILVLMLQLGDYPKAARLYTKCSERLTAQQRQQLEAVFCLALITGAVLGEGDFPGDSPILRHRDTALEALQLYCTGDHEALKAVLQKIPIRSPYKDLRILLSGLSQLAVDRAKGKEILSKIEKNSPYSLTASSCLIKGSTSKEMLEYLAETPASERSRFRAQHNMPPQIFKALEQLALIDDNPGKLIWFISRNNTCFTQSQKRRLLRALLPFCGGEAPLFLERSKEFTLPEILPIMALAAEREGEILLGIEFWDQYLGTLDPNDSANYKEIALVMRRQAALMEKDYNGYAESDIIKVYLDSLQYDPTDARSWLKAAELAEKASTDYKHNIILDDAVTCLPDNVAVLLAAMKASGKRSAHKKAANLAGKVLAIDPINTTAQDFLVESHLKHGYKLALQRKWSLAEKELEMADSRVKSVRFRGRNQICFGMVRLLQGEEDGLQHIEAGQNTNGYPVLGALLTSFEARSYKLPAKWKKEFDKELLRAAKKDGTIDRREFTRLISWMTAFTGELWGFFREACHVAKHYFSRAAGLKWGLEEGLYICKGLEMADLISALAKCSAGLAKQYPENEECAVWSLISGILKRNQLTRETSRNLDKLLESLDKKNKTEFTSYIEDVLHMRDIRLWDIACSDEGNDEYEIFIPKPSSPKKKKSTSRKKVKQLNLFEDI